MQNLLWSTHSFSMEYFDLSFSFYLKYKLCTFLVSIFNTQLALKNCAKTGFEPRSSVVKSHCYVNCATKDTHAMDQTQGGSNEVALDAPAGHLAAMVLTMHSFTTIF